MENLPARFPRDPWCRAGTRLMLTLDETGACFLGLTPDGEQPGRDMLARLSLWRGETQLPYTAAQESGKLVLRAEGGCAVLDLAFPERLTIEGEGISLLIGKGRAAGMFMSGGSAVDDPLPGALYVNAGARMRILAKRGSVEVRSAWDLNALSDPDPRIFLYPDESGALRASVFVTDFDQEPEEADTAPSGEDFARFLDTLLPFDRTDADALHAAYVIWTCLQPARRLAAPQISGPLYVSNRRTFGSAKLSDNVLLAALLREPAEAARQLCAFLPYRNESGMLPRLADNRSRLYEGETPYFGVVLRARPALLACIGDAEYAGLADALAWWQRERFCPEKGQFYYLHRYEPGFGARWRFPEGELCFAPELNACMCFWLDAMALLAERRGDTRTAETYRSQAQALPDALTAGDTVPEALELPLLLAGDAAAKETVAAQRREDKREITSLRRALTALAAKRAEGGYGDAV